MEPKTDTSSRPFSTHSTRPTLTAWLEERDIAAYRAGQILKWVYRHQKDRFEDMTNLAKPIRELLAAAASASRAWRVRDVRTSADGTRKYLFELERRRTHRNRPHPGARPLHPVRVEPGGLRPELRLLPDGQGPAAPQPHAGRDPGAGARHQTRPRPSPGGSPTSSSWAWGSRSPTTANLLGALALICDSDVGLGFAAKRVTVSTAGLVPKMLDFGRDTRVSLAVSLNAADDETRSRLMPINRALSPGRCCWRPAAATPCRRAAASRSSTS